MSDWGIERAQGGLNLLQLAMNLLVFIKYVLSLFGRSFEDLSWWEGV